MKFAYTNRGGGVHWNGRTAPMQSQAADLGAYNPFTRTTGSLRRYGVTRSNGAQATRSYGAGCCDDCSCGGNGGCPDCVAGRNRKAMGGAAAEYPLIIASTRTATRRLGMGAVQRPGAPEVVGGYESPAPGASTVHLGMGGYISEGSARSYGQTSIGDDQPPSAVSSVQSIIDSPLYRKAAAVACAFHGVRRHNGSIAWGLVWLLGGYIAPVAAPVVAVAQGFTKPK